jgi:hypothetical protein
VLENISLSDYEALNSYNKIKKLLINHKHFFIFHFSTLKIISVCFHYFLQIDCHDSGTESDGDLDSEDLNERDMELSEYIFHKNIILIFFALFSTLSSLLKPLKCHFYVV